MEKQYKFVEFEKYCQACKYEKDEKPDEINEKCDECLIYPALENSHKPLNFVHKTVQTSSKLCRSDRKRR